VPSGATSSSVTTHSASAAVALAHSVAPIGPAIVNGLANGALV